MCTGQHTKGTHGHARCGRARTLPRCLQRESKPNNIPRPTCGATLVPSTTRGRERRSCRTAWGRSAVATAHWRGPAASTKPMATSRAISSWSKQLAQQSVTASAATTRLAHDSPMESSDAALPRSGRPGCVRSCALRPAGGAHLRPMGAAHARRAARSRGAGTLPSLASSAEHNTQEACACTEVQVSGTSIARPRPQTRW
jgi:hypothetical protein